MLAHNSSSVPSQVPPSPWLTAEEAADYLKVKPRTILLMARTGKIKAYPLLGTKRHIWRFRIEDLDAIMAAPSAALVNRRIQ